MYGITNSRLVIGSAPSDVIKVVSHSTLYAGDLVLVDSNNLISSFNSWDGADATKNKRLGQLLEDVSKPDGTTLYDCKLLPTKWAFPVGIDSYPFCYDESYVQLSNPFRNRYHVSNNLLSVVPHNADVSVDMQDFIFAVCLSNVNLGTSWGTNIANFYAGSTNALELRIMTGTNNKWSLICQYVNNNGNTQIVDLITNAESANFTNLSSNKSRLFIRLGNDNSVTAGLAYLYVYYIDDITDPDCYTFSNILTLNDFGNAPSGNLTITKGIFGMGSGFGKTDASYDIITTSTGFGNGTHYSLYAMSPVFGHIIQSVSIVDPVTISS